MIAGESLRMAGANLWSHRLRSLLTILGVVIGVSSVLAVATLSKSFEGAVIQQFDDLDNRDVFVSAVASTGGPGPGGGGGGNFGPVFTQRDVDALSGLGQVDHVVPNGNLQVTALIYEGRSYAFRTLRATTSESDDVRVRAEKAVYANGTVFHDGAQEAVLGNLVAEGLGNLTGTPVAPGSHLTLRFADGTNRTATITGILAPTDSLFGQGNGNVYVPTDPYYTSTVESPATGQTMAVFSSLTVVADSSAHADAVRDRVKAYFETGGSDARQLAPRQLTIRVATQGDITSAISATFAQITLFINAIAGVSLVVGAIGIANIMLVSVTERTREIGVMKAIGARDGEILRLFLLESILIGLIGSAVGIALGVGLGVFVVTHVFDAAPVVPASAVAIGLVVGLVVGVVAGLIPARRATRIQPIKALAYE
ncbi:MAG TPA: ABC transporter permease [Candidatus Thermoplasmatota archaeon]|nr:ABC transporter permease [Candidatus Thermoplasmatota archaeon]